MNQDSEHLKLLTTFHYVVGGISALFACIPIFHLIIGLAMIFSPGHAFDAKGQDAFPLKLFGLMFAVIGGTAILFGWTLAACIIYAGRCLAVRKKYTFCLVMAGIACMFMPFGTVLGVFTIIVLMRPSVKELFGQQTPKAS